MRIDIKCIQVFKESDKKMILNIQGNKELDLNNFGRNSYHSNLSEKNSIYPIYDNNKKKVSSEMFGYCRNHFGYARLSPQAFRTNADTLGYFRKLFGYIRIRSVISVSALGFLSYLRFELR